MLKPEGLTQTCKILQSEENSSLCTEQLAAADAHHLQVFLRHLADLEAADQQGAHHYIANVPIEVR